LLVVNLVVSDRDLPLAVLEPLEDLLGRELAIVGEQVRIIEQAHNVVRNLFS
jgi:hypothetical protein